MGGEVSFDGLRGVVQIVDPCLVALFLRCHLGLVFSLCRAEQKLFNPGQPSFDPAQAAADGVVLLRHLRMGGGSRDCCGELLG